MTLEAIEAIGGNRRSTLLAIIEGRVVTPLKAIRLMSEHFCQRIPSYRCLATLFASSLIIFLLLSGIDSV